MTHAQRIRRVSDGVVASYIHDISARTGSGSAPEPARRADRLIRARRASRRREERFHVRREYQAA